VALGDGSGHGTGGGGGCPAMAVAARGGGLDVGDSGQTRLTRSALGQTRSGLGSETKRYNPCCVLNVSRVLIL
jgi:hypothetical protein